MKFEILKAFIEKSAKSSDLKVKKAADDLMTQMLDAQEAEEVVQPTLHSSTGGTPLDQKPKDIVDLQLNNVMKDLAVPTEPDSEFGKAASSFSSDVQISDLPKATQEDIFKFIPAAVKSNKVVLYGMVTSELRPKVDNHNWKIALAHITKECNDKGRKALADKFQKKIDNKYILLLNDDIIDGHHFLAMAYLLDISCSLKVLDLTPLRFQKTAASLYSQLTYALHDYSRKGAA